MPQARYNTVAIILHWVIALGIFIQIFMGLAMTHLNIPILLKFQLYQLHKSIGITVLLAIPLRIIWRLIHRPPALPAEMSMLELRAAEGTHIALYAFMLALPLTGWILVSVSPFNIPTVLYGLIPWPDLPIGAMPADKQTAASIMTFIHSRLAYVLIAVLAVHIGAALRHHFLLRDNILRRMLPIFRSR